MTADTASFKYSADTTALSYWLNYKFFLCAVFILAAFVSSALVIWKYEGRKRSQPQEGENQQGVGSLYEEESWNTCLKAIHPGWLLFFRVFSFFFLFSLISANVMADGVGIFYFYTQWTFTLVTIYFAVGSSMSIYGCCKNRNKVDGDEEQGTYVPPTLRDHEYLSDSSKSSNTREEPHDHKRAGFWSYALQILFQICAGAVVLTDIVFWLILYPFLPGLNFLVICMHSVNAIFLLGDAILNCMRFPMFRIGYFIIWTGIFVVFQWIIHACVNMWWPYRFLDLSNEYSYLWYFGVGVMHIPCYGIFALVVKVKNFFFSRTFPDSYRRLR